MNYVFITYYYPPDYGAGSFRASAFVKKLSKKIRSTDNLHIISTIPNRYHYNLKFKKYSKIKNIHFHRIEINNHKEKIFKKTIAGIIYFFKSLYLLFRLKPNIIISSSARLVSGLIAFVYCQFFKCKYFLDIRDMFSVLMQEMYSKNIFIKLIFKITNFFENKVLLHSISVNFVSPGFKYFLKMKLKNKTFFTNGYDENYLNLLKKIKYKKFKKNTVTYAGNIGAGQSIEKFLPKLAKIDNKINYKIIGNGGKLFELREKIKKCRVKNVDLIKPIKREKVIKALVSSDILLISLSSYNSLKYVIPSKIFEYILYKKPIIANFKGFIKNYSKKNFDNIFFFDGPKECYEKIKIIIKNKRKLKYKKNYKIFSRDQIMDKYTDHIIRLVKKNV